MGNKLVSTFPQRLKECLEENPDFTATMLAEEIGLSKQAISMYISGDRKPKRPTMKVISDALGVNLAWLMGYDVEKILSPAPTSITLSKHEHKVILAYRNKIDMQPAVDRLLEIEPEEETYNIAKAAREQQPLELTKEELKQFGDSADAAPNRARDKNLF